MSMSADAAAITRLEDERFDAMIAGNFDRFAAIAHPDLMYTHSNGVTDSLSSYMDKCRAGFYVYHHIEHPIDKIVVQGDVGLVLGQMNADLTAGGVRKQLANTSVSVWIRHGDVWKLISYQPTPRS